MSTFEPFDRRRFLRRAALGTASLTLGLAGCDTPDGHAPSTDGETTFPVSLAPEDTPVERKPYEKKPFVVLVRFGGGVRRLETISHPDKTFCPFIYHELAGRHGLVYKNVEITSDPGIDTSHGQGTLYLVTGKYHHYEDVSHKPFSDRFVPVVPTVFEYLRKTYDVPMHQALIVNGEDRLGEEFYTFSNNHLFGVNYRSTVLSLFRFKVHKLRQELARTDLTDQERDDLEKDLRKMEENDYRTPDTPFASSPELDSFWDRWMAYYGKTGLVNPRGDRLLTTLSLWAMKHLRPRLLMVNYQDPDYVHWGPAHFYTRAVSIIDDGVRELWNAAQADDEYRDNTVFVIVPDCGRDNNLAMSVPFQHHFNSKCSHQIFAVIAGPKRWVPRSPQVFTRRVEQTSVAATIGELMGFATPRAEAPSLFQHA